MSFNWILELINRNEWICNISSLHHIISIKNLGCGFPTQIITKKIPFCVYTPLFHQNIQLDLYSKGKFILVLN
jgi:hypothetical protein